MFSKFYSLTWDDFDKAIYDIANQCLALKIPLIGVYGVPRGGLILAVALSHRLGINLLTSPRLDALWVDDIVDTGKTLYASPKNVIHIAWVNNLKDSTKDGHRYNLIFSRSHVDGWVVFPWERLDKAKKDKEQYDLSRQ